MVDSNLPQQVEESQLSDTMTKAIQELDEQVKTDGTDVLLNDEITDPACDPDHSG